MVLLKVTANFIYFESFLYETFTATIEKIAILGQIWLRSGFSIFD